jgi:hypothetical protein
MSCSSTPSSTPGAISRMLKRAIPRCAQNRNRFLRKGKRNVAMENGKIGAASVSQSTSSPRVCDPENVKDLVQQAQTKTATE